MSDRDQRDRGALAALGLLLIAILAVAFLSQWPSNPSGQIVADQNGAQIYGTADGELRVLGDSWAQWLMAAFSVLATGVSLYALRLLRNTWKDTQRTADAAFAAATASATANEIARDSVNSDRRPWLDLQVADGKETTFEESKFLPHVLLTATNLGRTPAVDISFHIVPEFPSDMLKAKDLGGRMAVLMAGDDWPRGNANWVAMPGKEQKSRTTEEVPRLKFARHSIPGKEHLSRVTTTLVCGVRYRSIYESDWRFTIRVVAFAYDVPWQDPLYGEVIGDSVIIADYLGGTLIT